MEFINEIDLETIVSNGRKPVDDETFAKLKKIYEKLELLCVEISKKGFEYDIRKDPRKMAGQGMFEFQDYQWARVWPAGMRALCEDRFAYIVGMSDTLHYHIMGIKGYMNSAISKTCSNNSWTEIEVDGSDYPSAVQEFVAFDLANRHSFYDCGAGLGLNSFIKLKQQAMNQNCLRLLEQTKPQIILQGPPGTGKTYRAQELAFELIFGRPIGSEKQQREKDLETLEQSEQFQFVQFHPSYSYEDFVRGITAKASKDAVSYEVEDRIFAKMAKKALRNWENTKLTEREPGENLQRQQIHSWLEQWRSSLDERLGQEEVIKLTDGTRITRTSDSGIRYDGNPIPWKVDGGVPMRDLVEMYLHKVGSLDDVKTLATATDSAKSNSSYWWYMIEMFRAFLFSSGIDQTARIEEPLEERKKYVLVVDEINRANLPAVLGELIYGLEYRNRQVQSLYEHPLEGNTLQIPDNLYLIGTMNTADRSVGHIDYAIRRRFAFVDVLPQEDVIVEEDGKRLFEQVAQLFTAEENGKPKYLSSDFEARQVQLGHSYFMATGEALKQKLKYEIQPILREYLSDGILVNGAVQAIDDLAV